MTQENLKLGKKVYNNKEFNDIIDKDFSQLIKNQRPINIERFFGLYRELFYKIQRTGKVEDKSKTQNGPKQSHWNLILESQDYLNNYIDWRDKVIDDLFENIDELEEILRNKRSTEDHLQETQLGFLFGLCKTELKESLKIMILINH